MPVAVLQYGPQGDLASAMDGTLATTGLSSRTIHLWAHEPPPEDLTGIDGLIILGSAGHTEAAGDGLAGTAPIALIRSALHAGVPVLAAGDGARALVMATGCADREEHGLPGGCGGVAFTPAADADPLLKGVALPASGLRPAAGFGRLPREAMSLVACDLHDAHAFRIGGSAWGMGFEIGHESELTPWGEGVINRFAALVSARAEHTATRAFFTGRADAWEERFAYQTPAYAAAVARMHLRPGGRAVDLGCGTGRAMPALRTHVGKTGTVLGIDLTPAMLAAAGRHGRTRYGHLLAADCTRLPLPAASVDGIFSAGLLDHLPDPHTALREWARISAPDGTLLLYHPSGRAERAARHGRALDPGDLLADSHLKPALEAAGWMLAEYEDTVGHFLARATRTTQPATVRS